MNQEPSTVLLRMDGCLGTLGHYMITSDQCQQHAAECSALATGPDISQMRALILLSISRTWIVLANQTERLEDLIKEEEVN